MGSIAVTSDTSLWKGHVPANKETEIDLPVSDYVSRILS